MNEYKRPRLIEADILRFKNNKENWIAFIGLKDGKPYEIFTGIDDEEEGFRIPKSITSGKIEKYKDEEGNKKYRFIYTNKAGLEVFVNDLDTEFNPEFWNYCLFISSILRHEMKIDKVVRLVSTLDLNDDNINTWKNGVVRALKKYIPNGV